MSACVRIGQKISTKKPDLFSQTRSKLVEVTGFEPATFWSRILSSVGHPIPARPVESCCDWICSDGKAPSVGGFAWQTTGRMVPAGRLSVQSGHLMLIYVMSPCSRASSSFITAIPIFHILIVFLSCFFSVSFNAPSQSILCVGITRTNS